MNSSVETKRSNQLVSLFVGVWLTLNGNNDKHMTKMKENGVRFADHIQTGNLSPAKPQNALHTATMKTFEYLMEAINLVTSDW